MTMIKKKGDLLFLIVSLSLIALSIFLFIKKKNYNTALDTLVQLNIRGIAASKKIDPEVSTKLNKVQSELTSLNESILSLENDSKIKDISIKTLEIENASIQTEIQAKKEDLLKVESLENQLLVDDRITDSTLVDFLLDFWTTKNEGTFEDFKKMWHIDSENSSSIDFTVKYWIKNSNFMLKKIHYQNPYSDNKDEFVVSIESYEGNYTMIVGKKYDGEWKVTMMD